MAKKKRKEDYGELLVARHPRAEKQYEITERLEAGLVLSGSEVKSLRQRRADLEGAFAQAEGSEMVLHRLHIGPYAQATAFGHDPSRPRKLLMHRHQIDKWADRLRTEGFTAVPLALYFKKGYAKVLLGLAKGRRQKDRREDIKRTVDMKEARAAAARGRSR
ncbi:MAG: SsrA-binding protein SmpB [Sandaracinaceae bacterium]